MRARVLVVDDEKSWRGIIKRCLQEKYDVDTVESLKEALERLETEEPYHVVITDIGLSRVETNEDGFIILQKVYECWPMTSTIAVSGQPREVDSQRLKDEYHILEYLNREVLNKNRDVFIKLVDEGVKLSLENALRRSDP
jgi:two-component system, sporulation sensor kinase A